ncbi:hypothetical protein [Paenibacillus sp. 1001270B_150601_E10]|uniref:hypothetical protein n=1 Tax=Paenibacillus sp. 1001270B_150601_E10 TaxID=2787079 RepID=UPI0018A0D068|nr:hypothetical protein [Paenibacillus sp. 1001270B_150601_E10]
MKIVASFFITLLCLGLVFWDLPKLYLKCTRKEVVLYGATLCIALAMCYLYVYKAAIPSPYQAFTSWLYPLAQLAYTSLTGETN